MKVGIVSRVVHPLHGHGGMEKHVFHLATGLAERGVDVELFCMETDAAVPDAVQHENLDITFVPYREFSLGKLSYFSFIQHLFPYFHRLNDKDVVHFQGMTGGVPYAFLGNRPTLFTPHGMEQFKHFAKILAPFNALETAAAQKAAHIISLGPGNTQDVKRFLRVPGRKIAEIPNGVDVEFFKPVDTKDLEERYDLQENVVVAVSRLVEYKGHGLLVEAVNRMDDTSLVIAGDGPYRAELEEKAGPDVHFAGFVDEDELPAYYALGDVFALPTFGEGMPLSILESFACGTPVLSTAVGSIPDLVDDATGVLVEPESVDAIEAGLNELFGKDLDAMGRECRKRAEERYSWDATVEKTLDLYRDVLSSR